MDLGWSENRSFQKKKKTFTFFFYLFVCFILIISPIHVAFAQVHECKLVGEAKEDHVLIRMALQVSTHGRCDVPITTDSLALRSSTVVSKAADAAARTH